VNIDDRCLREVDVELATEGRPVVTAGAYLCLQSLPCDNPRHKATSLVEQAVPPPLTVTW
jgi:hypothetical protein